MQSNSIAVLLSLCHYLCIMSNKVTNTAYLILGSNLGEKQTNINKALELIEEKAGTIIQKSSLYSSEPWGLKDQDEFLNQAVQISTELSAHDLIAVCKEIENELGRQVRDKWKPREIDIDILFFNREIVHESGLKVPHPAMAERKFVLQPLSEINEAFIHPVLNYTLAELLENCPDRGYVRIFTAKNT